MSIDQTINQFFSWPLYFQIALPVGYLCHVIISHGYKNKKDIKNSIPEITVFALISQMTWHSAIWFIHFFGIAIAFSINVALAILIPLTIAVFWRKCLRRLFFKCMNKWKIFNSTEHCNVWDEITENSCLGTSQITVYMKDGMAYSSEYIYDFESAPIELYRVDEDGNIALYITHQKSPSDNDFQKITSPKSVNENIEFYRLTYIPKSEIQQVEFLTNRPC